MNEYATQHEQLNNYVMRTVNSGVKPMQTFLEPIYDCGYGELTAFRVNVYVNSLITGVLKPEAYYRSGADGKLLADMSMRSLKKAIALKKALSKKGNRIKSYFVRCAAEIINNAELYNDLKGLLYAENATADGIYITLFPEVLSGDADVLKSAFCDVRAAGFKLAFEGYGGRDFPIEKLLTASPDIVFASAKLSRLTADRDKHGAVAPLVNLIKSLGGQLIAEGIENDAELREFRTRDCFGFMPSKAYKGNTDAVSALIAAERAEKFIKHGGEDERY